MINFEAIKNMTIEEMARFIATIQINETNDACPLPEKYSDVDYVAKRQLEWLKEEVPDNA